ncbi:MAG: hypothetical protein IPI78_18805 [Chitinophagaceae bacterium]|nr:hypothetical protein [Chitinophagaceae bacterium]
MKKIIKSFVALFVVSLVVVNVNPQLLMMPASKAQKTTEESKVTKPVVLQFKLHLLYLLNLK